MRVIDDEVQLARIHGCVGPAFFALTVALGRRHVAALAARRGRRRARGLEPIERLAVLTTLLAYCQLVLGSQLRHLPAGTGPGEFRMALVFHLVIAAALVVHIVLLAARVFRTHRRPKGGSCVRPRACWLIGLQLGLGAATWVVKYGWPAWMGDYRFCRRLHGRGRRPPAGLDHDGTRGHRIGDPGHELCWSALRSACGLPVTAQARRSGQPLAGGGRAMSTTTLALEDRRATLAGPGCPITSS